MRRLTICALVTISALFLTRPSQAFTEDPARLVRESAPRTAEEERKGFHVPEGFEVQLFADESQLGGKPINMAFDARGRLWVTCTQEYPFAVKKEKWSADSTHATGSKDTIRILEDTDGDGRADKVTVFADELNIPTGLQPYKNGCVAWSIPNILFLEDTQHEGRAEKADKRTILFGPLGYEKDTHGMISSMRLGLDGWIYATHGFSNTSHFQVLPHNRNVDPRLKNQETLDITSGSVFRFRPDGSAVELWTSGQVNPFGLCWDSWGNLYSADCHSHPITQLIRGATYPQFGKPADALGFGPVMCEHMHGSTGIAGIIYLDGGVWGKEWDDHMFVGNPVTSKVNHDHITFTGSTPKANEQPDFLTSDDGWFRPVDLQLGPDGALYIADFYNKIIGHYELPLDDKRRDRSTGRIWRVVRKGYTGKLADCDFTRKTMDDLAKICGVAENLTRYYLAHHLAVQKGADLPPYVRFVRESDLPRAAIAQERRALAEASYPDRPGDEFSGVSGVTLVDSLPSTDPKDTHLLHSRRLALRCALMERDWGYGSSGYAGLTKMVEREHGMDRNERERELLRTELIRISCAVPTADAANWLLEQLSSSRRKEAQNSLPTTPTKPAENSSLLTSAATLDHALLTQAITHIARHLPAAREGELIDLVQKNFGDDLDTQLDMFSAVRSGQQEPSPKTCVWAGTLARRLVDLLSAQKSPEWRPVPIQAPGSTLLAPSPSPWFKQTRKCADGTERAFLCSLPPGGEKLTGTLRSKTFPLPEKLAFWIAGHRGFPKTPANEKNFVRLVNADTGAELARAYPPRNDTAVQVVFTVPPQGSQVPTQTIVLTSPEGDDAPRTTPRKVFLELVDGDDGTAYAWLAAGGFEPEVVTIPDLNSPASDKRIRHAAEIAGFGELLPNKEGVPNNSAELNDACWHLHSILNQLPSKEAYSADTRVALARLCLGTGLLALLTDLPELVRDPELVTPVFSILEDATPEHAEIAKTFKTLTSRAQLKLAAALAGSEQTAAPLLKAAPPRVLADPLVTAKIKLLNDAALTKQLGEITAKLPPASDAVNALIAARLKSFDPAKADEARGKQVFAQICVVCHRIGVLGNLVGPQLDGIGARGAERLLEDILDPNRAVDPAFRLHIVKKKSGELMTGLLRRDDVSVRVFADAAAQEHEVRVADIAEDTVSEFSLMPSGLGDVLTEQQLHDLLKFLLERK